MHVHASHEHRALYTPEHAVSHLMLKQAQQDTLQEADGSPMNMEEDIVLNGEEAMLDGLPDDNRSIAAVEPAVEITTAAPVTAGSKRKAQDSSIHKIPRCVSGSNFVQCDPLC